VLPLSRSEAGSEARMEALEHADAEPHDAVHSA